MASKPIHLRQSVTSCMQIQNDDVYDVEFSRQLYFSGRSTKTKALPDWTTKTHYI